MKTIKILLLIAVIAIGCNSMAGSKLLGNGKVIQKERAVGAFNQIETSGVFNVYLIGGTSEALKIEADENLQDLVIVKNKNNKLIVSMKEGFSVDKLTRMNVYITFKTLEKLDVEGVGNVSCSSQLHLRKFELSTEGVGNTDLDLTCNTLKADVSGVGNLSLRGTAAFVELESSSVGNVKAFDLIADTLKVNHSGVGNVEVNAQKEIYITNSGVGSLRYKGEPMVKRLEDSSIGKVKKM